MANTRKRYSFKKVMIATGIICVVLILIQVFALLVLPQEKKMLEQMLTLRSLLAHLLLFIFLSLFYYFTTNRYYTLIQDRKKFVAYIAPTTLAFLSYSAYYACVLAISPEKANRADVTTGLIIFSIVLSGCLLSGIALLIAYLTSLRDGQKQRKVLETQKMELEVENSQANFNFLKAQINPHFLHNTLNFFYAKALPLSEELSEGILCLSDIMRYALEEGGKNEKARLTDEIEHLENVIRINQFRFNNKLNVQFEVNGSTGNVMIVPFVLITLVENAFKHGDLKNHEFPIIIRINVEDGKLHFHCHNRKNPGFKDHSTGIGLQNILKRLDIMYGRNYSYKVTDDNEFYTTDLTITQL